METRVVPGMVVNEALEILEFFGATGPYVRFRPGRASLDLRAVLRPELRAPVLAAIGEARNTGQGKKQGRVPAVDSTPTQVNIVVQRDVAAEGKAVYRISFEELEDSPRSVRRNATQANPELSEPSEIGNLQRELAATRESFAAVLAEQEKRNHHTRTEVAAYSDLQAKLEDANAELEVANEELQAALAASQESERRLRESEQRFEHFMENLPGLAWIKDLEGRYIYANQAAEQSFGAPRSALYGRTDSEIFPHETAKQFRENDHQALASPTGIQTVETLQQEDGVHHSIVSKFPIRGMDGQAAMIGGVAIDITERRKAEEDLRRSERELAEFFENASVAVHSMALDGAILRANRTELEMLGYSRDEYVGRQIADFHADRHVIDDILARLMRGETLREYPARLRHKDGSIRDVLIDANALFEDGQFVHTRCFTRDVTALKRAQTAQAALAAIVESSGDAIVSKSLDGIIQSWNPAAERIFGYSAEEAIGRPILLIVPPDRASEEQEILRRIRAGQRVDHFESVRLRKDGRGVPVSLTISPIKNELGKVVGASKIARDVSARKQSEQALRESEERFRTLADSSPALIWVNGLDGCEFVNRAYLDFLGVEPGDVQKFEWAQFLHPADHQQVVDSYQAAFAKREVYVSHHRFRRADGQYRWMKTVGLPRWSAWGELEGYVGSTLDVTDIKEAEDALREADRRKNEFLATLGHELRNPLAAISTGVTLLQAGPAPDRRAWIEEMMTRQVKQLQRLVDDLLDVSRITRGKIELRREHLPLLKPLDGALAATADLMKQQGIELSFSPPPPEIHVDADPARIEQMVVNLLTNAAKYTPQHGKVWLSVEQVDQEVIIRCRDTGIGLSPDILDAIFEPFAQFNLSAERIAGGLGMGLTLVRALAEMHGGSVVAASAGPGKGSEFAIHLPAAPSCEPQEPVPTLQDCVPAPPSEPLKILVVDDNRDLAQSLALFFRDAGHEVSVAHDGETAIPMALRQRPEIVFLDIGLPGMDGFGVADQLRASEHLHGTMIVAISGWKLHERAKSAGTPFDVQLVKPLAREQLVELLQQRNARARGV